MLELRYSFGADLDHGYRKIVLMSMVRDDTRSVTMARKRWLAELRNISAWGLTCAHVLLASSIAVAAPAQRAPTTIAS